MNCKNCEVSLNENANFCYACGGKVIKKRITVQSLVTEFFQRYLSFDSKFFTTFKTMFGIPEKVINGYIEGSRGKYVDPFSYVIIAITLSGISYFLIKSGWLGVDLNTFNEVQSTFAENEDTKALEMQKKINAFVSDFQNIIILLSIPLLAFVAKLTLWKNKNFNFAEHNVVLAYTYSHTIIALFPIGLIALISPKAFINYTYFTFVFMLVYFIYVVKRVYDLTKIQLLKKVLLYALFFSLFFVMFMIIGALIGFFLIK